MLYNEACVIDKRWGEYKPNQTTEYAVNIGFIMSKPTTIKDVFTWWCKANS